MEPVSITEIAAVTGGIARGENGYCTGVEIDSRRVRPGDMFCALPGERADGHDYVSKAFELGAECCLVSRVPDGETRPLVVVPDVEAAIRALAKWYRAKFDIPVIGITGSVGKTTAKEMIASVLSLRYNTLKTEGNFNNDLGVPLTIFRIDHAHEAAVVEMGISHFGDMTRLAEIAAPSIAVFTIIGHSHLEYLRDRQGVFKAKTEMLPYMPKDGVVFYNGDDDLLSGLECVQTKISFGLDAACNVRAENIRDSGADGSVCDIVCGDRRIHAVIPAFGAHMIYAALEGAAVGIRAGLTDEEIAAGISAYESVGRRARRVSTDALQIIDDCYNSNPTSAASAIVSLCALPGRKVCILGDMLELGEDSEKLHYALGAFAAESGVPVIIACGKRAEAISKGAREHQNRPQAWHFPDKEALIDALPMLIHGGDCVLVKASRGMKFEDIVSKLEEYK